MHIFFCGNAGEILLFCLTVVLCHSDEAQRILFKMSEFFFAPQNIEKLPSKVAHNPTRPPVFSPASFFFVKLRQF